MTTPISETVLDNGLTRFQHDGWYEDKMVNELHVTTTAEIEADARLWRDGELTATDHIPAITDHPQRAAYINHRTALRNWPSTSGFPATRPTLGE
tara:strand:- start:8 stop:292 length:285 start_codon:yes stop_codon:yes gene_type:complete